MEYRSPEAKIIIAAINQNTNLKTRLGIASEAELSPEHIAQVEITVKSVRDKICLGGRPLRFLTKQELEEITLDAVIEIQSTITANQVQKLQDTSFVRQLEKLKILTEEVAKECMNVFPYEDSEQTLTA